MSIYRSCGNQIFRDFLKRGDRMNHQNNIYHGKIHLHLVCRVKWNFSSTQPPLSALLPRPSLSCFTANFGNLLKPFYSVMEKVHVTCFHQRKQPNCLSLQFFLQLFYEMSMSAEEVLFIFFKKRCAERQLVIKISIRSVTLGKQYKTIVNTVVVVLPG